MLDSKFIGGAKCKQNFPSVLWRSSTLLCQPQWDNWLHLLVLWKKVQVYLDYWQEIQYFIALYGKIMKAVSLLQRAHILLQGQTIFPSIIVTFDFLLVMAQLTWTGLIPPNRLQTFSKKNLGENSFFYLRHQVMGCYFFLEIHSSFTITKFSGGVWEYNNVNYMIPLVYRRVS